MQTDEVNHICRCGYCKMLFVTKNEYQQYCSDFCWIKIQEENYTNKKYFHLLT